MNPTISRILVPVDFSPYSEFALQYAVPLAARFGAAVHLLHVVEPIATAAMATEGMYMPSLAELEATTVAEAERRLAEHQAHIAAGGTAVTTEVLLDNPAAAIVETARSRRCDLIVMGTHGRAGLAHLFMGSVAEKVTRLAPSPVLTVRETEWAKAPAPSTTRVAAA